jgi:PPOX class probable F420-dependent enzyme
MRITPEQARSAFQSARVATRATAGAHGQPHQAPVTSAPRHDLIITAIDHKPKSSKKLKRVRSIEGNPNVTIFADHYDEDWSRPWRGGPKVCLKSRKRGSVRSSSRC